VQQLATDAKPEGIAAGQQHHPLLGRALLQPIQAGLQLIGGQQRRRGGTKQLRQRAMQPQRSRHQAGLQQQLPLGGRQGGRCAGVGADHLDHGAILTGSHRRTAQRTMTDPQATPASTRRQRVHELLVALLAQRELDLLDGDSTGSLAAAQANPAGWLERNRRILQRYQALVRSAATLDALVEQEAREHPSSHQL